MRAEILADGTLVVTAETPTEAYALKCYNNQPDGVVQCNWDEKSLSDVQDRRR
jgi:hypothetical protein